MILLKHKDNERSFKIINIEVSFNINLWKILTICRKIYIGC